MSNNKISQKNRGKKPQIFAKFSHGSKFLVGPGDLATPHSQESIPTANISPGGQGVIRNSSKFLPNPLLLSSIIYIRYG